MNTFHKSPSLAQPIDIIENFTLLNPQDGAFLRHPVIERFGSPEQSIYVDQCHTDIEKQPLILPIVNGELERIQYAVLFDNQTIEITKDGENCDAIAKGFAYLGTLLQKDKPVIITYGLEAFFKVAQTGYAVVLVVMPNVYKTNLTELKPFDFEQIEFVIHQLQNAGYEQLYIPVRAENIKNASFQKLEQNTTVRLIINAIQLMEMILSVNYYRMKAKKKLKVFSMMQSAIYQNNPLCLKVI